MKTVQIRVRVGQEQAEWLLKLKPRSRGRLVRAGVGAIMQGAEDLTKLGRGLEELRKIGVNLNQLVYLVNRGGVLSEQEGKDLRHLLGKIRGLVE